MSQTRDPRMSGAEDWRLTLSAERFLFHEAELLDDGRFEDWLDLLCEDFVCIAPLASVDQGDDEGNSFFEETKETYATRVKRLRMPAAWSENPPSRTVRLLSNVRAAPSEEGASVRSNFCIYRARYAFDATSFFGRREDILRSFPENPVGWRLARRVIRLTDAAINYHSISILL
jgi:3-phenylpropionate/cinnamic acid dioxygenase small subunit